MIELQLGIGFTLLKSEKLEFRIQGFKEINEQIKNSKFSNMRTSMKASELILKLKENNIFELIFGEKYHI